MHFTTPAFTLQSDNAINFFGWQAGVVFAKLARKRNFFGTYQVV
jgi:hypothetical protein